MQKFKPHPRFFLKSFLFKLVVLCDAQAAAASAKLPVQQTSGLAWPAKICAKKRNEEEGKSCKLCWERGKASESKLVVGQFLLPGLLHFDVPSKFS